jgi:hypothetical protein
MKKISQKFAKIMVGALLLTTVIPTVASAQSYFNKYVNGSTYTVVASGSFDNSSNYVTVTVTEILTAEGAASNYKKVKSDVLDSSGNQISSSTDVELDLGSAKNIMLKQTYPSGKSMKLRMKGNTSSLDCQVTFSAPIS